MPELPEVQSMIDALIEQNCLNKAITNVATIMPKIFKNCNFNQFYDFVINEKIITISRLGKYLIFHLTHDKVFVVHLRMEGKLFFDDINSPYDRKHTLILITMGKYQLRYHDTRRFGTFTIYSENNYLKSKELGKLGLDPLQKGFDWKYLKKNISNSSRAIKTLLLDQTNVAGIGNIYADEILFASLIHPQTPGKNITDEQFKEIAKNATKILQLAIENKGTTISTYFYKKHKMGEFQKFLKVHTKKGYPCPNCKAEILKLKVNGRGTYICPKCQKK